MSFTPVRSAPLALALALVLAPALTVASSGCACPPCAEAPANAPAHAPADVAQGKQPTAAEDSANPTNSAAPASYAPSGTKNLLWDGDTTAGTAKGWADCEDKGSCTTKLEVASDKGVNGSAAVHFQGQGSRWIGMGWNWFGWWPKNAGSDISPYDTLKFSLRVVVSDPNNAPQPAAMTVALRCSAGEKTSASVTLERYVQNPGDGKWHDIEVPLAEFYKGDPGKSFDPKSTWELNLGTWAPHNRSFDIYLDNITVLKK